MGWRVSGLPPKCLKRDIMVDFVDFCDKMKAGIFGGILGWFLGGHTDVDETQDL